jgi:hypothetical protein
LTERAGRLVLMVLTVLTGEAPSGIILQKALQANLKKSS